MNPSRNINDYGFYPEYQDRHTLRYRIFCGRDYSYLAVDGMYSSNPYYWDTKQEAETFLKEFCMENYAVINGTKVKLSDETVKELTKALIPEETYAVGDILISGKYKVMVAKAQNNRVGYMRLNGGPGNRGYFWNSCTVTVGSPSKITKAELCNISASKWEKVIEDN